MARPLRIAYPGAVYRGPAGGMRATRPPAGKAQAVYRPLVRAGRQAGSLWRDLHAQSILGEDAFAERLIDQIRGHERIAEIPKSQRFAARPPLHRLLGARDVRDRDARNARIAAAVEEYGYTQQAIAAHLGLHFTSISRILRSRQRSIQ